jgi:hypothetical protein
VNGETIEISTLIALGGLVLTLVALVGGVLYRLGALTSRVDQLDRRFDDVTNDIAELREENRHNHQQLLQALAHHTHDSDTGFAIFRIPPGAENPTG